MLNVIANMTKIANIVPFGFFLLGAAVSVLNENPYPLALWLTLLLVNAIHFHAIETRQTKPDTL